MPDIVNPYVPGQPVDDPDLFFGRRDVLGSIGEHLVKGRRVFVISSVRRMGKTSLVRQLPAHLSAEFIPVLVELLQDKPQRLDSLLWRLAEAISDRLGGLSGLDNLRSEWDASGVHSVRFLQEYWPEARKVLGGRRLVLVLDDLGSLAGEQVSLLDPFVTFLTEWRDLDDGFALVLTASVSWQETLIRKYPRLFGGALTYLLGPLSSEEATRLVTWPVDGVITYDYGVARRLSEFTSGQPYYLQLLCFEVFNRCAVAGWVNQRDLELVVEDLVGREIAEFRQSWDESSPPEQGILAALVSLRGARGVATAQEVSAILTKAGARVDQDQVATVLENLTARGILERLGALSYRFRVALLRDWLAERVDLQQVVRDTRWTTPSGIRTSSENGLPRLRVRKQRRQQAPTRPEQPPEEVGAGEAGERPGPGRRWFWVASASVLGLVLLVALGRVFFLSPIAEESPTATLTPLARLATATLTLASGQNTQAVPIATWTPTPRPEPSATPEPTPLPTPTVPVIVSRPVPSIAYLSRSPGEDRWSIYVMNSDGGNRTILTAGQSDFLSAPTWSPDGSKIAFVSDQDGAPDIWVMNSDGSELVNLTRHEAKDHSPAWSPDGAWIAFASVRDSLYWELYLMRADGSDLQRLTWWEDASDLWPTWSPDGARLAFASKRDGNWEIYTMTRDGANLVRLTDHSADDTNPSWSPDGSRIAFESTRDGYAEIYVMPVVGGEGVNVSNTGWATDLGPTWSADGGRLVFYSDRDGDWDVYTMNADGSNVVKLTGDQTSDQLPAWRP